jgi:hypothetical protein
MNHEPEKWARKSFSCSTNVRDIRNPFDCRLTQSRNLIAKVNKTGERYDLEDQQGMKSEGLCKEAIEHSVTCFIHVTQLRKISRILVDIDRLSLKISFGFSRLIIHRFLSLCCFHLSSAWALEVSCNFTYSSDLIQHLFLEAPFFESIGSLQIAAFWFIIASLRKQKKNRKKLKLMIQFGCRDDWAFEGIIRTDCDESLRNNFPYTPFTQSKVHFSFERFAVSISSAAQDHQRTVEDVCIRTKKSLQLKRNHSAVERSLNSRRNISRCSRSQS